MDVEDEEENKALTEELVASLRDTVRGRFLCVRSLTSSSSFFMSLDTFFSLCLLIPDRIRACERDHR